MGRYKMGSCTVWAPYPRSWILALFVFFCLWLFFVDFLGHFGKQAGKKIHEKNTPKSTSFKFLTKSTHGKFRLDISRISRRWSDASCSSTSWHLPEFLEALETLVCPASLEKSAHLSKAPKKPPLSRCAPFQGSLGQPLEGAVQDWETGFYTVVVLTFLKSLLQNFQPQRQWCIKIRLRWAQKFYTPLVLGGASKCPWRFFPPTVVVYKIQSPKDAELLKRGVA